MHLQSQMAGMRVVLDAVAEMLRVETSSIRIIMPGAWLRKMLAKQLAHQIQLATFGFTALILRTVFGGSMANGTSQTLPMSNPVADQLSNLAQPDQPQLHHHLPHHPNRSNQATLLT